MARASPVVTRIRTIESSGTLLAVVALCALLCYLPPPTSEAAEEEQKSGLKDAGPGWKRLQLSKSLRTIFDFGAYKRLFHKSYRSLIEELVRRKYFLARAVRALLSSIKYIGKQLSYYLAINHMSDMAPEELDAMDNKVLEAESEQEAANKSDASPGVVLHEIDEPPPTEPPTLESFGLETLFNEGLAATEESEAKSPREGAAKSRRKRETDRLATVNGPYSDILSYILRGNQALEEAQRQAELVASSYSDVLFVDHRRSGCLLEPRGQGMCGCCYSFTMVAYMEWLYCMIKGSLASFSEQYMIDCGKKRVGNLNGCSGGGYLSIAQFVLNFGLELRTNYPYRKREDQCPYADNLPLARTGKVRWSGFENVSAIPLHLWHAYLVNGPMAIEVHSRHSGFKEYGGGVYDGAFCRPNYSSHMVLLVGHGREEGRDYWLIRNSFTVGWGEAGYMKLWKGAACIHPKKAHMYGTRNGGITFEARPVENLANDHKAVRQHYAKNIALDLKNWNI